jgi:hypothetical protein
MAQNELINFTINFEKTKHKIDLIKQIDINNLIESTKIFFYFKDVNSQNFIVFSKDL